MAFDLTGDVIATFLGVNDAPREPVPSKAGNGAHLIKQHNSLVSNTQNILNSLGGSVEGLQSRVSAELQAMENRIAEIAATLSSIPVTQQPFLASGSHIASPGQKVIFFDYYTNEPLTLFLPVNPLPGSEISLMHINPDQPIWIKNENQDIFRFQGSPTYEIHLIPIYEMASLIYVGFNSAAQTDFGWMPTNNTAFIKPSSTV